MTVIDIKNREVEKADNDQFLQAGQIMDSHEVEANARHAENLTRAYQDAMTALIHNTAELCNGVDADDETEVLKDYLNTIRGDSFANWKQQAEAMRREG